jgi:hypothetical protein
MARAAIKKVAQAEIRAAKSFLERRGIYHLTRSLLNSSHVLQKN